MTSVERPSADAYTLIFDPSEWVSEERLRAIPSGTVALWVFAACAGRAISEILAMDAETTMPLFWIGAGSVFHLFGCLLGSLVFTAFASASANWSFSPRLESRLIFRMSLLSFAPWVLAAPLGIIARYFDAFWTVWIPGEIVLWVWSLMLLYCGLRRCLGLSVPASVSVLVLSVGFVAASVLLTLTGVLFSILLHI